MIRHTFILCIKIPERYELERVFKIIVRDLLDASDVAKKQNDVHPKVFMVCVDLYYHCTQNLQQQFFTDTGAIMFRIF